MELMRRWFDLHLYWANWGTRRFVVRIPTRYADHNVLEAFKNNIGLLTISEFDDHLILDIHGDGEQPDYYEDVENIPSSLSQLAPLRQELLSGDLTALYLVWLESVASGAVPDEAEEPLPGIGRLSPAAQTLARFFLVDSELIEAAVHESLAFGPSATELQSAVQSLPRSEINALLVKFASRDPYAEAELRKMILARAASLQGAKTRRTAAQLRAKAEAIRAAHRAEAARKEEQERKRRERKEAEARAIRVAELKEAGEKAWDEVEENINLRNAKGYQWAASLLDDLRALAESEGTLAEFSDRLANVRDEHARKRNFMKQLAARALK